MRTSEDCEQVVENTQCRNKAIYRYTWPGRNEAKICGTHAPRLLSIAKAIGLHLQLTPLTVFASCQQKSNKRKRMPLN